MVFADSAATLAGDEAESRRAIASAVSARVIAHRLAALRSAKNPHGDTVADLLGLGEETGPS